MRKKLTLKLHEAWKLCLKQRKWIAGEIDRDSTLCSVGLKYQWFTKFGKGIEPIACCYFCEYDAQFKKDCTHCPGKLVSYRFSCGYKGCIYNRHPRKFYAKLLRLDKKRRTK